ncbi:MAG: cytochrome [Actinotalea sp.]|nr:cytochrome [Actinotalea sp.]
MAILERASQVVRLDSFDAIMAALRDPALSRAFDKRTAAEGNHRERIVSVVHGTEHRDRRRLENRLFRRDMLVEYEREQFPGIIGEVLDQYPVDSPVDLLEVGGVLSVPLACRRAGIDHAMDLPTLRRLFELVLIFSQGTAILDVVGDEDLIRNQVFAALDAFRAEFFDGSRARREALIAAGDADPNGDALTLLLAHLNEVQYDLDDGLLLREVATFVQGGTHTSAQTLVNAVDLMLAVDDGQLLERVGGDRALAQRVIHETLRLRPTTPEVKRLAEFDTSIAGIDIPQGTVVVLDIRTGNRDAARFGDTCESFDPERTTSDDEPLWGLSFGGGQHVCIGRTSAGGFPVTGEAGSPLGESHSYGLVAQMLQSIAARGVHLDADDAEGPQLDLRTDRGTRWRRYPVRFAAPLDPGVLAR